jgi:hypothetical protein
VQLQNFICYVWERTVLGIRNRCGVQEETKLNIFIDDVHHIRKWKIITIIIVVRPKDEYNMNNKEEEIIDAVPVAHCDTCAWGRHMDRGSRLRNHNRLSVSAWRGQNTEDQPGLSLFY